MNEVCSKDSINWLEYDNHRNTNKIHKSEERTILRKWIKIKVDLIKINKYNYFVYKIVIAFFKLNKRISRFIRKRKKVRSNQK